MISLPPPPGGEPVPTLREVGVGQKISMEVRKITSIHGNREGEFLRFIRFGFWWNLHPLQDTELLQQSGSRHTGWNTTLTGL